MSQRVAADHRYDVVTRVVGLIVADDRQLVGDFCQLRQRVAEGHARQCGRRDTCHRADAVRSMRLRVKGLELTWSTLLKEKNHRIAGDMFKSRRCRLSCLHRGERHAGQGQAADA